MASGLAVMKGRSSLTPRFNRTFFLITFVIRRQVGGEGGGGGPWHLLAHQHFFCAADF